MVPEGAALPICLTSLLVVRFARAIASEMP